MIDKLKGFETRYAELQMLLADNDVLVDQSRYQQFAKEFSELTPFCEKFGEWKNLESQRQELIVIAGDASDQALAELAAAELEELPQKIQTLAQELADLLNPAINEKDRNLIFEIRAGTGGQEASLFAADLFRMYSKYADQNKWQLEMIESHESETGGFKEIIFSVKGAGASKRLKWESGAHRVQRVPVTETSGRIHTSAATVAVLFEPEDVEIEIDPNDVKVDVYRSSGPGGQSVNTTDSAIRLTHLPTGIVVTCQDERSQLKNKYKAMRVLRARLLAHKEQENRQKESMDRKLKVGSGDRSEKIRTYNFPDRRITDHRIGFTTYKLAAVMDGALDELTQALIDAELQDLESES